MDTVTPEKVIENINAVKQHEEIPHQFPYSSRLSFHLLIEDWRKKLDGDNAADKLMAQEIFRLLEKSPEFLDPIDDEDILEQNKELKDLLISGLFPTSSRNRILSGASSPFNMENFYQTPKLKAIFDNKNLKLSFDLVPERTIRLNILKSSGFILNQLYDTDINVDTPFIITITDTLTGLERHYKSDLNLDYCEVRPLKPMKPLSKETISDLLKNMEDTEKWTEHLPSENFEFVGVVTFSLHDITEEETFSRLKLGLLEKNAVGDKDKYPKFEKLLRTFFGVPDLEIGMMGKQYAWGGLFEPRMVHTNTLVPFKKEYMAEDHSQCAYASIFAQKRMAIIDDLQAYPTPSSYEKATVKAGYRSVLVAPLLDDEGNIMGMIEMASKKPSAIRSIEGGKLREILPAFSVAMQRFMEEQRNSVDVLIKSQYTSIHKSVEWRFVDAAMNFIENKAINPELSEPESIQFSDVYPFFGQADIVGSSSMRNTAIQEDLIEQLEMARSILEPMLERQGYPIVQELDFQIKKYIHEIQEHLNSGDEVRVTEFLQQQVEPLIEKMFAIDPSISSSLENYRQKLDSDLGVIYSRRKAYEESLSMINETLASLVDQRQKEAQEIFPHFFERYNTDGIEYNMYIGQSIVRSQNFDKMYLDNLRLWQLMLMCEVTRSIHQLQPRLKVPMTTAQLMLVFSDPIAIRFKMDEKQFDVDGSYNIRYEVIKKRIDKAHVEGTGERMTQAGKLAIVYTHDDDKREYMRYLDFLKHKGLIEKEIEELDIEPLQGVFGLKALRITPIVNSASQALFEPKGKKRSLQ